MRLFIIPVREQHRLDGELHFDGCDVNDADVIFFEETCRRWREFWVRI